MPTAIHIKYLAACYQRICYPVQEVTQGRCEDQECEADPDLTQQVRAQARPQEPEVVSAQWASTWPSQYSPIVQCQDN